MPCNGVTVLRPVPLKDETWQEIKGSEAVTAATAQWLTRKGFPVEAIRPSGTEVIYVTSAGTISVGAAGVRASGAALPPGLAKELAAFTEKLAGYAAQSRLARAVEQRSQVLSKQRAANGALVMEVRL